MFSDVALILISLVLGGLRIAGVKNDIYKDCAHLWVGGLFGGWFAGATETCPYLAIGLCVVEVGCFVYFRIVQKTSKSV